MCTKYRDELGKITERDAGATAKSLRQMTVSMNAYRQVYLDDGVVFLEGDQERTSSRAPMNEGTRWR